MRFTRTPKGRSASSTAPATDAGTGSVPASPAPLTPRGLIGLGVVRWNISMRGILWGVPGTAGLFAFVACFGISNGMATLVRATLVAELWGRTQYGAIAGALSVWSTLARAVAPLSIGLTYLAWGGYRPILFGLAILSALAVLSAGRALSAKVSAPSQPA